MDLLGSIMGSMEKPPSLNDAERKKVKAQKAMIEKQQEADKKKLVVFREKIQKRIHEFIKDPQKQKFKFEVMDKVYRAIVHEVTDVAGLTSFSFGVEEQDRYVMCWKKEFAPTDDELQAYRKGEEWDPEKAKLAAKQKEIDRLQAEADSNKKTEKVIPVSDYKDKYKHLIGDESAKDGAKQTLANRSYGFVPSENKRDRRTVEQVLADTRAKKKLKTESSSASELSSQNASTETTTSSCLDLP
ncbi:sperm-associated antigen 7 homolog [Mytilus edulis]|uniref:sperm-associated antigen 7 homolog n=1 Tax=Mytilus edulis TaxID=6550 RepID=UPI0039F0E470